ncbi:MAG: extracellular solute-binding protein [Defluviitaleaceae bacterium]|nr:extracellular solute-binding protein [Defluviitaleaceae bacterium]
MQRKKLFLSVMVVSLFMLILVGCSDNGVSSANASFERTDWRQPFPETVTVTIGNDEMAHAIFADGEDIFDNLWTRRWLEVYNINVETVWASPDYPLAINLAIASGDLPDMFHVDSAQFQQLLDAGLIEDLTDVFDFSSPGLRRMFEGEQVLVDTPYRDGRLYGFPRLHYGFVTQAPFLWVRKDWYEQAGSPAINTVADLEALMENFMNTHDTPFAMILNDGLFGFWNSVTAWHAPARTDGSWTRFWIDDGQGGIMSAYESPGMLDALAAWRSWYERGWIRHDFPTVTWDGKVSDIVSGNAGIEFGPNWRGFNWSAVVDNFGDDAYLIALPIPTIDGRPVQIPVVFPNVGYNVVRRGFAHPEILPMLISDYTYVINEAAILGTIPQEEAMRFNINDMNWVTGPFKTTFPHYDDIVAIQNALRTGDESYIISGYARLALDEIMEWINFRNPSGLGRYLQMGHPNASLVIAVGYEDGGQYLYSRAWGPMPQEILDFGGITDSIIDEGVTRIIAGVEPLEHWYIVLENWRNAGGNAMTQAINERFGN